MATKRAKQGQAWGNPRNVVAVEYVCNLGWMLGAR